MRVVADRLQPAVNRCIRPIAETPPSRSSRSSTLSVKLNHRLCAAEGLEPHIATEAREAATIIGLVAAECGISILPNVFDSIRIKGTCFRLLDDATATQSLALASRARESNATTRAFLDIAAEISGAKQN